MKFVLWPLMSAVSIFCGCSCAATWKADRVDLHGDVLPRGAVARFGTARLRHGLPYSVAWSADGRHLASAGPEGVCLWDSTTGKLVDELSVRTLDHFPTHVAFSPDGRMLASSGTGRHGPDQIRLWDVATGERLFDLASETDVNHVTWFPDGKRLTGTRSHAGVSIWDEETGRELQYFKWGPGAVYCVHVSSDGTKLAAGGVVEVQDDPINRAHLRYPGLVRVWDVETGELLHERACHDGIVVDVTFSPGGDTLASAGWDGAVRLWDAMTGEHSGPFLTHNGRINAVRFSPDGARLASGGEDGCLRLWDVKTRREILTIQEPYPVEAVAFSPDGATIASAASRIALWDARCGREITPRDGHVGVVTAVAFGADGETLFTAGDVTLRTWDLRTMEQKSCFPQSHKVHPVAVGHGGALTAIGNRAGGDHLVRLWKIDEQESPRHELRLPHPPTAFSFSPVDDVLATASDDRPAAWIGDPYSEPGLAAVHLWDWNTGMELTHWDSPSVFSMAFSPDGRKLALGFACGAELRDLSDQKIDHTFALSEKFFGGVRVCFSPDGRLLVTGARNEPTGYGVSVWDVATGELKWLGGLLGVVWSIAVSPDAQLVASSGNAYEIDVRSLATGKLLDTFRGHRDRVLHLAFSPDGRHLVSGSQDSTVLLWDLGRVYDKLALEEQ